MAWTALADKATGRLVSIGTRLADDAATRYDLIPLGETPPDWSVSMWDAATRTVVARPPIVWADRLDDIEARFLADVDFMAVYNTLTAGRKTTLRTGIRRVLLTALGPYRMRQSTETVELT